MILRELLRVLGTNRRDGRNLSEAEAYRAFATILDGVESEVRVGAFLIALRMKGVTVEELVGFARAARDRATLPCHGMENLVAVCPPHEGYERSIPLEVAAGLIAAAAGARVLLVTDRCVPPRRGLTAASVLEHLGCGLTWDPREVESWVAKTRFGAIAATGMLPAMLALRSIRDDIGVRTPLSTIEKLLAPSTAAIVLGAQAGPVLGTAVEVMQSLGHPAGMTIQGVEGGVVPTVKRRSRGIHLDGNHQVPMTIDPGDFGFSDSDDPELPMFGPPEVGQGVADNPQLVRAAGEATLAVLAGQLGTPRNAALMCAAILLRTAGVSMTFADGVDRASAALDSGGASAVLERLRSLV
ncbi:anthranilate phosphoribosyltransferase [Engelhardtia mirabilis]|uniref:Anthranilate phosphoribosyltransferase n=1 Tax=Engelhardtia mirabilis TaxID=2528011 RepID=A0A518BDJ9_9BACT|nr:Anthranilate phosphoribosyltransferase [Planctomycetes bacterium Pla133]QDU99387.1 Anthranilate phosphoribosyltransferase [Planctomycetes bacterium Pla86]